MLPKKVFKLEKRTKVGVPFSVNEITKNKLILCKVLCNKVADQVRKQVLQEVRLDSNENEILTYLPIKDYKKLKQ